MDFSTQTRFYDDTAILKRPLPKLLSRDGYQTTSSALHQSYYNGKLRHWGIADEVANAIKSLDNDTLPPELREALSIRMASIVSTTFAGMNSPFAADLCRMSFTLQRLWRVTKTPVYVLVIQNLSESQSDRKDDIPDFVGVICEADTYRKLNTLQDSVKQGMRIVGEAKTPWAHDLLTFYQKYTKMMRKERNGDDGPLRHALGMFYFHPCILGNKMLKIS